MNCKNCGKENNNGTNFCTRKCRMEWINKHKVKGAKKKAKIKREQELMSWGSGFLNVD
jgi:hypothetical protein